MKATVLIDNIAEENLTGEWGLSILIEYEGKKYLLDAGTTGAFAENAEKLGINLADIDFAVLSHAHYDHSDGFPCFFARNATAPLYIREGAAENCYHAFGFIHKYIGVKKGMLTTYADRIRFAAGDFVLSDGVYLIPHKTENLDAIGKSAKMCVRENGQYVWERFAHEQSLVFRTKKGLVIFNSCSHGGAANIIREVMATFPNEPILALIGGFHLFASSDAKVRRLAEDIKATGIRQVVTGHCTGEHAFSILKTELGDCVSQLNSGLVLDFGD